MAAGPWSVQAAWRRNSLAAPMIWCAGSSLRRACAGAPAAVSGWVPLTLIRNGSPAARSCRTVVTASASRASSTTGRRGSPGSATSSRHTSIAHSPSVSSGLSDSGIEALIRRCPSSSHAPDRCSRQLTGLLIRSDAAQTPKACWALRTWPKAGKYRRSTPTECSPAFGMIIGRTTHALGSATRARYRASCPRTSAQSHVELLMKWCSPCSVVAPPVSAAMFRIDLRPSAARRPRTYSTPRLRWSRRGRDAKSTEHSSVSTSSWAPAWRDACASLCMSCAYRATPDIDLPHLVSRHGTAVLDAVPQRCGVLLGSS